MADKEEKKKAEVKEEEEREVEVEQGKAEQETQGSRGESKLDSRAASAREGASSAKGKGGDRGASLSSAATSKPTSAAPNKDVAEVSTTDMTALGQVPQQETVDPATAKLHLTIANAFKVFDNDNTNSVDVNEIGTIVRSLGCCPSEEDLQEIILECEEEESTGTISYERFEPVMTRMLKEKRFKSSSVDDLVEAFKVLDEAGHGHLDPEEFAKMLTERGEAFTEDEVTEMFRTAVDVNENRLYYEDHAMILALDDDVYPYQG